MQIHQNYNSRSKNHELKSQILNHNLQERYVIHLRTTLKNMVMVDLNLLLLACSLSHYCFNMRENKASKASNLIINILSACLQFYSNQQNKDKGHSPNPQYYLCSSWF